MNNERMSRRQLLKAIGVTGAATSLAVASTSFKTSKVLGQATKQRWAMVVDVKRCIGCMACVAACKAENNVPIGFSWTWIESYEKGKFPNVSLSFVPKLCNHCENPVCVYVCPTGATYKRDDGIVMMRTDYGRCIGCRYCMVACPYGVRRFNWKKMEDRVFENPSPAPGPRPVGVMEKCSFCYHRVDKGLLPACVTSCIGRARIFGDLNDPNSEVSRLVATRKTRLLKGDLGTKPQIYYVELDEEVG